MNLPGDTKVFLEDRETNTITRLDEANASYKVTLNDALNGTGRFYLHTKASGVLSTEDVVLQNISIYATNKSTLRVVGLTQGKATVKMYNILGKQVMQTSFSSTGVKEISLPKLATGMYIIQLETATGKLNKKIVLE
nr:T9SS type A sorting domain-containing protein [Polaribacter sp. BAL334]